MHQFAKFTKYSLFIAAIFSFQTGVNGQEVFPESLAKIAKSYDCHEDKNHYKINEKGVKAPYHWGVVKNLDPSLSVVFWCNYKEENKIKSKIVIHVDKSAVKQYLEASSFAQCPNQITNVIGSSTGVWVENNSVMTGFEDGIYYFCKDGEWKNSDWH